MKPVREITSEEENVHFETLAPNAFMIKRDPVEPVPVGTYVVKVFKVTGYDPDCDGSLMARLSNVDKNGEETGWEVNCVGLYPDSSIEVDSPGELWKED